MNIPIKIFRELKTSWHKTDYIREDFDKNIIISYHEMIDVDYYLNCSTEGIILKQKIEADEVKCIFIPFENYVYSEIEKYIYKKNKNLLKHKNVQFYSTHKLDNDFTNIIWGINILEKFYNLKQDDIEFNGSTHLLTLNGQIKNHRVFLKQFLEKTDLLKKSIYSFGWLGISPDLLISNKNVYDHSNIEVIRNSRLVQYSNETLHNFYKECLFEIVCPTAAKIITEKSLKPILCGTPFILWLKEDENDLRHIDNILFIIHWYENIGIDIDYFDIDYKNINCLENKIKELMNMSIYDIQQKYKDTFDKAKQNKEIIKLYLKNYYNIIQN